jgi:hypothetical protein
MTGPDTTGPPVLDRLRAELLRMRENVAGVHGSLVATCDGFLVAEDLPGLEAAQIAALVATTRGLATSSTTATGRGDFREVLTRGTAGYVAVYAAGDTAVLAVIGNSDLNVAMLNFRVREAAGEIAALAAQFGGWAESAQATAAPPSPPSPKLPARRPPTRSSS